MGSYTQLRDGAWGIRVPGRASQGQSVAIRKKDGTVKTEVVVKVLWTGSDSRSGETISLCAIAQRARGGRRNCDHCGSSECPRAYNPHGLCDED